LSLWTNPYVRDTVSFIPPQSEEIGAAIEQDNRRLLHCLNCASQIVAIRHGGSCLVCGSRAVVVERFD
jgi:hypothetical protein